MRESIFIFALAPMISGLCFAQSYTISTIAGTTRLLDGSNANTVPLRTPQGVVVDSVGNIYIADTNDNRIRKINPFGIISTYAGTGVPGYSGDRGKATLAQLSAPFGLAMDSTGNLYIADRDNYRVRKISSDGTINTVAGNGRPGSAGDNGSALNAQILPFAVAVDSQGNLFISTLDFRVRKVDVKGNITTIAGTGNPGYAGDNGPGNAAEISLVTQMACDPKGNVYLADSVNAYVRRVDTSGMISPVAGSGFRGFISDGLPATSELMLPTGVAVDQNGNNLYISDVNRDLVRRVDLSSGLIYTVAGNGNNGFTGDNGAPLQATLNFPGALAVDSSNQIYVSDFGNKRVRRINPTMIATVAGTNIRDGGPATSAFLNFPFGLAVDGTNSVVIADQGNSVARRFTAGGNISSFGALLENPAAVATDAPGNYYVTDDEPIVLKITPSGNTTIVAGTTNDGYTGDNGQATSANISTPTGVTVDTANNVYITDYKNKVVRKVTAATGIISTIAGSGKPAFSGDGGPALSAGLDPYDVAIDSKNNLYIADQANNRIRKVTPDGIITTAAGNGIAGYSGDGSVAAAAMLAAPSGVAVDGAGNLYIADNGNSVVRRVTSGLITTIAGNGQFFPPSGDGGPAIAATVAPFRVSADTAGNVYISDSINDRVRMLTLKFITPKAMNIVSGNNQTTMTGLRLSAPLVVKIVDASGAGVPGIVVNFAAVPSSAATLNSGSAITLNDGTAGVTATLGSMPGQLTITASAAGVSNVSFSITAISATAPSLSPGGIAGAGLSTPSVAAVAPNGIASIFGVNFAPAGTARQVGSDDLIDGKIPGVLAGACAQFGATRAPILGVYPNQLNIQVPKLPPGPAAVTVINKCDTPQAETSLPLNVMVQAAAPEFFYFAHAANGHNPIAAVNALTGGYVGSAGLIPGASSTPAKPGDILTLFGTAFGATDPAFDPGVLPGSAAQVTAPLSIVFGGVTLAASDILYVGVTQFAGLYQVNLRVPDGVADGDQPLVITVGGVSSPANAFITVSRTLSVTRH